MLTFPDPPIPTPTSPDETPAVTPLEDMLTESPAEALSQDEGTEACGVTAPLSEPLSTIPAVESPMEGVPSIAPTMQPPQHQPRAVVVRRFTQAPADAYEKLNTDFGLNLDARSYAHLQKLFADTLRRDPTVGEIYLLRNLERFGSRHPRREGVGELYTGSPAIAETWADMMAKHSELYAAEGLFRKQLRVPPPCTFEEALTLIGRYLHRTGRTLPMTDALPFGGKNSDGRTAVLCTPAQEADAIAEGYGLVRRLEFGNATRSLWVRHGAAMKITPATSGDFLVCLPAPDPWRLSELLKAEKSKSHPAVGSIVAISRYSPLETLLTLCNGADLYPARFPHRDNREPHGSADLLYLCQSPTLTPDTHPDYLIRVSSKKVQELTEILRAADMAAVSVGRVNQSEKIRIYMRQGNKDIPMAELNTGFLRTYPALTLYRRQLEDAPVTEAETPAVSLLDLPEEGLTMTSATVTVTDPHSGYAAAMGAISAAVAPLIADGDTTDRVRLSVSLTAADGEDGHGSITLGILCGLYRAAAEGCMAMEDPALTIESPSEGTPPCARLSVVAYRLS